MNQGPVWCTVALLVGTIFLSAAATSGPERKVWVEREAYLMGTHVALAASARDRHSGLTRLDRALRSLEDTEQELSTWRVDSRISELNRSPIGAAWPAGPRVCRMFGDVFDWQTASGGAFDPAIGALTDAWQIHGTGRLLPRFGVDRALARSGLRWIEFDRRACVLTRRADVTIDVGAFGKGEAIDRAAALLGEGPWMIDLGGQVTVGGLAPQDPTWTVDLADPADRQRPVAALQMTSGSLSTSGGSERDLRVSGHGVSHILDPRTGQPSSFDGSVSVWHERALVADILSTALHVMGPDEGLRWAAARAVAAAYLISHGGHVEIVGTPQMVHRIRSLSPTTVTSAQSAPRSIAGGRGE